MRTSTCASLMLLTDRSSGRVRVDEEHGHHGVDLATCRSSEGLSMNFLHRIK